MEKRKSEIIVKYVLPVFGYLPNGQEVLMDRIAQISRLHRAVKYQELETPGSFDDGRVWFSIDAMVHSYYYSLNKKDKCGTRIWKKRELILFTSSLLEKQTRSDYVQMLEAGEVLSISYKDLLRLIDDYPELERQIRHVSINNERYYHQRNVLLHKPSIERITQFHKENPSFINCTSQEVQAMHLNLTRVAYIRQLRRINN